MAEERTMQDDNQKLELKNPTVYQTNENCQVFTGPISGCVFAMPGAVVNQSPVQQVSSADNEYEEADSTERRVKHCIDVLWKEGELKHLYDYTWVMEVMNQTEGLPCFKTPNSFIAYLKRLGNNKLPSEDSINKKQNAFSGDFPNWEFTDCDTPEANRRINVARRFLKLYRTN